MRFWKSPPAGRPLAAPVSSFFFALLLTLGAVTLTGCDDDGDGMAVDAGPDALGAACRMVDCASRPMPQHQCMNGRPASYVCARAVDGRCVWDQPVCAPDVSSDAGIDGRDGAGDGPNSEVGDGAVDDDAIDAPADGSVD
jgi:hypothetical protein